MGTTPSRLSGCSSSIAASSSVQESRLMLILANVIQEAFSPLIAVFQSILVFIHTNIAADELGSGDRRADGSDTRASWCR